MSLEEGRIEEAGVALREAGIQTETGNPHSHEQRAARAILTIEHSFRSGQNDLGSAALQDAEILVHQFLIADPRGVASLERTVEIDGLENSVGKRVTVLADSIRTALSQGGGAP